MHWLVIVLLINALLGFILIEVVLRSLRRYRTVDEERDSKFPALKALPRRSCLKGPAWRRNDS